MPESLSRQRGSEPVTPLECILSTAATACGIACPLRAVDFVKGRSHDQPLPGRQWHPASRQAGGRSVHVPEHFRELLGQVFEHIANAGHTNHVFAIFNGQMPEVADGHPIQSERHRVI